MEILSKAVLSEQSSTVAGVGRGHRQGEDCENDDEGFIEADQGRQSHGEADEYANDAGPVCKRMCQPCGPARDGAAVDAQSQRSEVAVGDRRTIVHICLQRWC